MYVQAFRALETVAFAVSIHCPDESYVPALVHLYTRPAADTIVPCPVILAGLAAHLASP